MKYLVEDKDALFTVVGDEITRLINTANTILREEGPEELQRYEDRLLHEFCFLKARIDVIYTDDRTDKDELTRLQYRISALNEALLYITDIAPDSNLAKELN